MYVVLELTDPFTAILRGAILEPRDTKNNRTGFVNNKNGAPLLCKTCQDRVFSFCTWAVLQTNIIPASTQNKRTNTAGKTFSSQFQTQHSATFQRRSNAVRYQTAAHRLCQTSRRCRQVLLMFCCCRCLSVCLSVSLPPKYIYMCIFLYLPLSLFAYIALSLCPSLFISL